MGTSRRWCNFRIFLSTVFAASIAVAGLLGLHKPMLNGCTMTYMYPTYIPVPAPLNSTNNKYKMYLYHEGWKRIDYQLHLVKLSGVPVLFIPGNGGSYKQVRSPSFLPSELRVECTPLKCKVLHFQGFLVGADSVTLLSLFLDCLLPGITWCVNDNVGSKDLFVSIFVSSSRRAQSLNMSNDPLYSSPSTLNTLMNFIRS